MGGLDCLVGCEVVEVWTQTDVEPFGEAAFPERTHLRLEKRGEAVEFDVVVRSVGRVRRDAAIGPDVIPA